MTGSTVWRVATQPLVLGAIALIVFGFVYVSVVVSQLAHDFGPAPRPDLIVSPDVAGPAGHCPSTDGCTVSVWGHSVVIGPDAIQLDHGGLGSERLLLYGKQEGLEWYVFLTADVRDPGTHPYGRIVEGLDAWDDGDGVIFAFPAEDGERTIGVRLSKADGWEHGLLVHPDSVGRYPWWYDWYLDVHGRIVDVQPGAAGYRSAVDLAGWRNPATPSMRKVAS